MLDLVFFFCVYLHRGYVGPLNLSTFVLFSRLFFFPSSTSAILRLTLFTLLSIRWQTARHLPIPPSILSVRENRSRQDELESDSSSPSLDASLRQCQRPPAGGREMHGYEKLSPCTRTPNNREPTPCSTHTIWRRVYETKS